MYKKVSVVLGALALMVAIGFGASQSIAAEKVTICHVGKDGVGNVIDVTESSAPSHMAKHAGDLYIGADDGQITEGECLELVG